MASKSSTVASPTQDNHASFAGIAFGALSFITMLLVIPPMLWHGRNRNIGATALAAWLVVLLLINFVNAMLWPTNEVSTWPRGRGLCDVEVKILVAGYVGLPASFACILRGLATVLDVDRATVMQSRAQKTRNAVIDLIWCVALPMLQMLFGWIVQTQRYSIYTVSGCAPTTSPTWVTTVLIILPPMIWVLIDAYYAVIILIRLYRYRTNFGSILANGNTPKSRFVRLYAICVLWIVAALPVESYLLYANASNNRYPFSWSAFHNPTVSKETVFSPGDSTPLRDRWIALGAGIAVFIFFGFGKDAVSMYRAGLLAVGFGKILPSLRPGSRASITTSRSSLSKMAKSLFNRKNTSLNWTWTSDSSVSPTTSCTDSGSPIKLNFLRSIDESIGDGVAQANARPNEVVVKKEVTLETETVETLPAVCYVGV